MAEKMVAYCGLVCSDCGAYIATQKNDEKMREKVAKEWTEKYHHNFRPKDIKCDGCLPVTVKAIQHVNYCPIRKCGQSKKVANCGFCVDYSCAKLEDFFKKAPDAKKNLDASKKTKK